MIARGVLPLKRLSACAEVEEVEEEVRLEVTDGNRLLLFTVIVFGVDAAAAANLR